VDNCWHRWIAVDERYACKIASECSHLDAETWSVCFIHCLFASGGIVRQQKKDLFKNLVNKPICSSTKTFVN